MREIGRRSSAKSPLRLRFEITVAGVRLSRCRRVVLLKESAIRAKELWLDFLAAFSRPEWANTPSAHHYRELIGQAKQARTQGEHWKAQQLASAAHKWAMTELTRLQRLDQAEKWLAETNKRLEKAWDQDRDCTTIDQLRETHPELKRVITTWESAQQRVQELLASEPETSTLKI